MSGVENLTDAARNRLKGLSDRWTWAARIFQIGLFVLALGYTVYVTQSVVVPIILSWVVATIFCQSSTARSAIFVPGTRDRLCRLAAQAGPLFPTLGKRELFFEREHPVPVVLHIHNNPAIGISLVEGLVQLSDVAIPIVGILALSIGMVNE